MFKFDTWSCPEEAGVSSAGLRKFLKAVEDAADTVRFHSLILLRHGKVVFRMNIAPYDDVTPHTLFSLSKSFTSAAAGFAVAEGLIDWNSTVVDILPEEIPAGREDELRPITLEALLCMGSGLAPASDSPSPSPDITWARHVLSHEVQYPPMTHFHYNSFGTYLVSCMIQKVTGQTIRDYLMPRLFEPLGIPEPVWDLSPEGICCGGFGLHLSSESIARFGQCLLQHGCWQGKQVLPEGWVERATSEHIANYTGERAADNEWGQGYGYQFWRCIDNRFRGDGMYGQVCMVDEARDAVVAATCAANDMQAEFKLLRETLWSAFDAAAGSEEDQLIFREKLATMAWPYPADDGSDQPLPEGSFTAEFQGRSLLLKLDRDEATDQISLAFCFGGEELFEAHFPRKNPEQVGEISYMGFVQRYIGAYGWENGKLHITMYSPQAPDTVDGYLTWAEDRLTFNGLGVDFPNGQFVMTRNE